MPASAGRVRMPHNNRVPAGRALATSDIWSKTIGHDPYAATEDDGVTETEAALHAEKTKTLLELAKHQNLGVNTRTTKDGADDFARKMFLGLKDGKKRRRADVSLVGEEGGDDQRNVTEEMKRCLEAESSSSEEEFVDEDIIAEQVDINCQKESGGVMEKDSMGKKSRKKKTRKNKDDSSSSSEDSSRYRHRRRKRHKKRKEDRKERRKRHERKRRRERSRADDSSESSGSDVESMEDKQQTRVRRRDKSRHKHRSSHRKRKKENIDERTLKSAEDNNSVAS